MPQPESDVLEDAADDATVQRERPWVAPARLLDAVSTPKRILILRAFQAGEQTPAQIAEDLSLTRAGLQRHIDIMLKNHIIERAAGKYRLTARGREAIGLAEIAVEAAERAEAADTDPPEVLRSVLAKLNSGNVDSARKEIERILGRAPGRE